MDPATERKVLRLVGLGVRGRGAVIGVEQVRQAAHRGTLRCAVVAGDASRHSQEKVRPLLAAKRVLVVDVAEAAVLGAAVGREVAAAVGITDVHLARGIRALAGTAGAAERSGPDGAH